MANLYSSIDQGFFKTPDMGEYWDEDLMEDFINNINSEDPKSTAYYLEEPFTTQLGYSKEYEAFVISAKPQITREAKRLNEVDGDTMIFTISSVEDGGHPFTIKEKDYKGFKDYAFASMKSSDFKKNEFKIRTVGVNAPEITHYISYPITKESWDSSKIRMTYREILNSSVSVKYDKTIKRNDTQSYDFIKLDTTLHEVVEESVNKKDDRLLNLTLVSKDDQTENDFKDGKSLGVTAKDLLIDLLKDVKEEDIRLVIDAKQLKYKNGFAPGPYTDYDAGWNDLDGIEKSMSGLWQKVFGDDVYKYLGYNQFGQDTYRRFLGAIYVKAKVDGMSEPAWINTGKYIKAKMGDCVSLMVGNTPQAQDDSNGLSSAFKLWSYDNSKIQYADAFFKFGQKDLDDRREIQRQIANADISMLREYTVMIGDCLFMVPPTSIRVVNQIQSQRVSLLRSKGTMTKEKPHNDRLIEMTLYFNDEHGINGVPVEKKLPNGQNVMYYMNGLRSLISMFKFTPFLPLENKYLNDTLGIDAVALANIQVQTMPSYPKCVAVTLTLQQFNYRVYMNELPLPIPEEGQDFNMNVFGNTINYGVMRYYYQRAIQRGEDIKKLPPLSQEYIEATMGSKTALIPAEFKNQNVEFFILDDNWLDIMLKVKEASAKKPINQINTINDVTKKWAKQVGVSCGSVLSEIQNLNNDDIYIDYKQLSSMRKIDDAANKFTVKLMEALRKKNEIPYLTNVTIDKENDNLYLLLHFNNGMTNQSEQQNLMKAIYKEEGITEDKFDCFKNCTLRLKITPNELNKDIGVLDREYSGYKVAKFMAYRSGTTISDKTGIKQDINLDDWSNFSQSGSEEFLENVKENADDLETSLSAKFKHYPLNLIVQQMSINMGNVLSNTKLKVHEGYAAQYAGGQDTVVDFVFHTKDEATVTAMNALQEMTAEQLLKYRKVITCCPVRINSELTRLAGINEVLIESVDITTVPMQPGLFAIQCRAVSVDRTMRNREALKRIDEVNNAGAVNPSNASANNFKTYFDINKVLAKAEVYPDLELPTIEELEKTGYYFIKYLKNKKYRIFPDPDFYFVYGFAYSAQMMRKAIVEYFKKNGEEGSSAIMDSETNFKNSHNLDNMMVKAAKNGSSDVAEYMNKEFANPTSKNIGKQTEEASNPEDDAVKKKKEKLSVYNDLYTRQDDLTTEIISNTCPYWNVAPEIKCAIAKPINVMAHNHRDTKDDTILTKYAEKKDKIIKMIDDYLNKPIDNKYAKNAPSNPAKLKEHIQNALGNFSTRENIWNDILKELNMDITSLSTATLNGLYESAAFALSGNNEVSDKKNTDYYPRTYLNIEDIKNIDTSAKEAKENIVPYSLILDSRTGDVCYANSLEQALKDGITFGPFQIKKYDKAFLKEFYNKAADFKDCDFLDPYYNSTLNSNLTQEEVQTYKENCIKSPDYSIRAFDRIVMLWLKKLIEDGLYLNYLDLEKEDLKKIYGKIINNYATSNHKTNHYKDADVTNDTFGMGDVTVSNVMDKHKELNGQKVEKNNEYDYGNVTIEDVMGHSKPDEDASNEDKQIYGFEQAISENHKQSTEILKDYQEEEIAGKLFLPTLCAVISGDNFIYGKLKQRDIPALIEETRLCESVNYIQDNELGKRLFRKFIRGLTVTTPVVIKKPGNIGSNGGKLNGLEQAIIDGNESLWVDANMCPEKWIMHSYYDMIMNDKRGRMARAFPTYYMLFLDEGRKIGYWKLHDNFYNMNSITDVEIIKSRKIAADTARIGMTNLFKTYTTDDEDLKVDYERNARDVFESIFFPKTCFDKEEQRRMQQMNIEKVQLKPGARMHVRMGYSGDASELPILFNGKVAEITPGEVIEIVAQGDAIELTNPQAFASASADELDKVENEDVMPVAKWIANFFESGTTPKSLISNMLCTKNSFFQKLVNYATDGRFFNDNMFGIVNFGSIDDKSIHSSGEVMQNIYEADGTMPWSKDAPQGTLAAKYSYPGAPNFTINLADKSAFDILNICANTSLEYITAIAPFGFRSTIFYGRPHYYYAYDYVIDDDGRMKERRKPFQQYHIIDSYSDIIANNIKANASNVKTCCVPSYIGPGWFGGKKEKKLDPMWIDWDIYPECQKTMCYETGVRYKGSKLGMIAFNKLKDEWSEQGGEQLAWRMGAQALKNSVRDMYEGEVIMMGDPAIKPYDKCHLHDIYENMNGAFEVEAVVHRLTPETGFTSSVFADCISTVDSRFEQLGRSWTAGIIPVVMAAKAAHYAYARTFTTKTRPMLNFLAGTTNKGAHATMKAINSAAELLGKDEIIKYGKAKEMSGKFYNALGMSNSQLNYLNILDNIGLSADKLSVLNPENLNSNADIINMLKKSNSTIAECHPEELANLLEESIRNGNVKGKKIEEARELISNLKLHGAELDKTITEGVNALKNSAIEDLKALQNAGKLEGKAKTALNVLEGIEKVSPKEIETILSAIEPCADVLPSLAKNEKAIATASNLAKTMHNTNTLVKDAKIAKNARIAATTVEGIASASIVAAAEMAVIYVITKSVQNWIENRMASFNVLQIYPLMKNGVVHVAGVDGNKGLVVGSPTWNKQGPVDSFIQWAFKDRGPMYSIITGFFFTDKMRNIAKTYKRSEEGPNDDANKQEDSTNNILKAMAEEQASNYSAFKAMTLVDRIQDLKSASAQYTYKKDSVSTIEKITQNEEIINKMIPITKENSVLSKYYSRKLLINAHDVVTPKTTKIDLKFDSKYIEGGVTTKAIELKSGVYDIPFLRPDAFRLFTKLVENIDLIASSDKYGEAKPEDKISIWLKSATTAGDNSWSSTGYVFRIQVVNFDKMKTVFSAVERELRQMYIKGGKQYVPIFQYRALNENTYEVFVSPRDAYMKFNLK